MSMRGKVIPFPKFPRDPGGERGLVEVRRCAQAEALVLKGLFESEGIPTLLRSRLAHSVYPFSVGGQGEVVVLVPASEAALSRRLLFRLASSPPTPLPQYRPRGPGGRGQGPPSRACPRGRAACDTCRRARAAGSCGEARCGPG